MDIVKLVREKIKPYLNKKVYIAYSGGPDSTALLHICCNICKPCVVYIDENQCIEQKNVVINNCNKLGLQLCIKDAYYKKSGEGYWRSIRYKLMVDLVSDNSSILTGHCKNDQGENVILQACRGSSRGFLMQENIDVKNNKNIFRPLLEAEKETLLKYCKKNFLTFFKDKERDNLRYKIRSILDRKHILGLIKSAKWVSEKDKFIRQIIESYNIKDSIPLPFFNKLSNLQKKYAILYFLQIHNIFYKTKQIMHIIYAINSQKKRFYYAINKDADLFISQESICLKKHKDEFRL